MYRHIHICLQLLLSDSLSCSNSGFTSEGMGHTDIWQDSLDSEYLSYIYPVRLLREWISIIQTFSRNYREGISITDIRQEILDSGYQSHRHPVGISFQTSNINHTGTLYDSLDRRYQSYRHPTGLLRQGVSITQISDGSPWAGPFNYTNIWQDSLDSGYQSYRHPL